MASTAQAVATVSEVPRRSVLVDMSTRYGMEPKLGHVSYEREPGSFLQPSMPFPGGAPRAYGEETAREIDCAVRDIVAAAFARAVEALTRHRDRLERGAALLLEKETLTESELVDLVSGIATVPSAAARVGASR